MYLLVQDLGIIPLGHLVIKGRWSNAILAENIPGEPQIKS